MKKEKTWRKIFRLINYVFLIIFAVMTFIGLIIYMYQFWNCKKVLENKFPKISKIGKIFRIENNKLGNDYILRSQYSIFDDEIKLPMNIRISQCALKIVSNLKKPICEIKFDNIELNRDEKLSIESHFNIAFRNFDLKELKDFEVQLLYNIEFLPEIFGLKFRLMLRFAHIYFKKYKNIFDCLKDSLWSKFYKKKADYEKNKQKENVDSFLKNIHYEYQDNILKIGLKKNYVKETNIFTNEFSWEMGNILLDFDGLYNDKIIINGFNLNFNENNKNECFCYVIINAGIKNFTKLIESLNDNLSSKLRVKSIKFYNKKDELHLNSNSIRNKDKEKPDLVFYAYQDIFDIDMLFKNLNVSKSSINKNMEINNLYLNENNLSFDFDFESEVLKNELLQIFINGFPKITLKFNNFIKYLDIEILKARSLTESVNRFKIKTNIELFKSFNNFSKEFDLICNFCSIKIYEKIYRIDKNIQFHLNIDNEFLRIYLLDKKNVKKLLFQYKLQQKTEKPLQSLKTIYKFLHKLKKTKNYDLFILSSKFLIFNYNKTLDYNEEIDKILNENYNFKTNYNNTSLFTFNNVNLNFILKINSEDFKINLKSNKLEYDSDNKLLYGETEINTKISLDNIQNINFDKDLIISIILGNCYEFFIFNNKIKNYQNHNSYNILLPKFDYKFYKTMNNSVGIKVVFRNKGPLYNEDKIKNAVKNIFQNKNYNKNLSIIHSFEFEECNFFICKDSPFSILLNTKELRFNVIQNSDFTIFLSKDFETNFELKNNEELKKYNLHENQNLYNLYLLIKKFFKINNENVFNFSEDTIIESIINIEILKDLSKSRKLTLDTIIDKKFLCQFNYLDFDINNYISITSHDKIFMTKLHFLENENTIKIRLDVYFDPIIIKSQELMLHFKTINTNFMIKLNINDFIAYLYNLESTLQRKFSSQSNSQKDEIFFQIKKFEKKNNINHINLFFNSNDLEEKLNYYVESIMPHFLFKNFNIHLKSEINIRNPFVIKYQENNVYYTGLEINFIKFIYNLSFLNNEEYIKENNNNKIKSNSSLILDSYLKLPDFVDTENFDKLQIFENDYLGKHVFEEIHQIKTNKDKKYKKTNQIIFNYLQNFKESVKIFSCSRLISLQFFSSYKFIPLGTAIEFLGFTDDFMFFYTNTSSFLYTENIFNDFSMQSFLISFLFEHNSPAIKNLIYSSNNENFMNEEKMSILQNKNIFYFLIRYKESFKLIKVFYDNNNFLEIYKYFSMVYYNDFSFIRYFALSDFEKQENYFLNYDTAVEMCKKLGIDVKFLYNIIDVQLMKFIKKHELNILKKWRDLCNFYDQLYYRTQ